MEKVSTDFRKNYFIVFYFLKNKFISKPCANIFKTIC